MLEQHSPLHDGWAIQELQKGQEVFQAVMRLLDAARLLDHVFTDLLNQAATRLAKDDPEAGG